MDYALTAISKLIIIISLKIISVSNVNKQDVLHFRKLLVSVQVVLTNINLLIPSVLSAKILIAINVNPVLLSASHANHIMD